MDKATILLRISLGLRWENNNLGEERPFAENTTYSLYVYLISQE